MYFTSDLHLGHQRILDECRPQFKTTDEMDEYLINKWNKTVTDDDDVYILGDLSYKSKHSVESYLSQMSGKKHLIIGNHDYQWMKAITNIEQYFVQIENMCLINYGKSLLTLCHYPMLEWNRSRYANDPKTSTNWLIHGHIHNSTTLEAYRFIRQHLPCALNAGVDINNYVPVTFEQLIDNNNQFYNRE